MVNTRKGGKMADESDNIVNELYAESHVLYKEYTAEVIQFTEKDIPINGEKTTGDGTVLRFKNGYLHAEGTPAIEGPGHAEYWENGILIKALTDNFDTLEIWENGQPVRIEKNLAERRENGEEI